MIFNLTLELFFDLYLVKKMGKNIIKICFFFFFACVTKNRSTLSNLKYATLQQIPKKNGFSKKIGPKISDYVFFGSPPPRVEWFFSE